MDKELRRTIGYNDTGFYMDIVFKHNGNDVKAWAEIPFKIFVEGVRKFFNLRGVQVSGADNGVWNTLHDLDALDKIAMDNGFIDTCRILFLSDEYKKEFDAFYTKWAEEQ